MKQPLIAVPPIRLADFDPDFQNGLDKASTRTKTAKLGQRLAQLQELLYANAKQSVLVVLQGMDASDKDGAVKSLARNRDRGFQGAVARRACARLPVAHPQGRAAAWPPRNLQPLALRGCAGRARDGPAAEKVWRPRYEQINAFEAHLAANDIVVLKFFLHVSKDEQAKRLRERLKDPGKNWKFEALHLEMRARWNEFQRAYEDALNNCSTPRTPWHILPADRKWYRDYVIAKAVVDRMEELKLEWPKPREDLSKFKVV